MIKNMDDLRDYLHKQAETLGGIEKNPDCDINYSFELEKLINCEIEKISYFPKSYIVCLKKYNIFNVDVGYFDLTPLSSGSANIIESLIRAQSPEESFLPRKILDPLDLYWIGNNNNDTIYVAGKNSPYEEGEIIDIHEFIFNAEEKDYDNYIMPLATNFEQFLIIAGNLNDIHCLTKDPDLRKTEMLKRLKALNVDEKYHLSWLAYL